MLIYKKPKAYFFNVWNSLNFLFSHSSPQLPPNWVIGSLGHLGCSSPSSILNEPMLRFSPLQTFFWMSVFSLAIFFTAIFFTNKWDSTSEFPAPISRGPSSDIRGCAPTCAPHGGTSARNLLDWSITPTALKFWYWVKLEDIHHELVATRFAAPYKQLRRCHQRFLQRPVAFSGGDFRKRKIHYREIIQSHKKPSMDYAFFLLWSSEKCRYKNLK